MGKKLVTIILCMVFVIFSVINIYAASSPTITVTTGGKVENRVTYYTVTGKIEYSAIGSHCASYGYLSAGYKQRGSNTIFYTSPCKDGGTSYSKTWQHTHSYALELPDASLQRTYVIGKMEAHYKSPDGQWNTVIKLS